MLVLKHLLLHYFVVVLVLLVVLLVMVMSRTDFLHISLFIAKFVAKLSDLSICVSQTLAHSAGLPSLKWGLDTKIHRLSPYDRRDR